ncbi:MAG: myo-inosose-2 dehydratase [Elusimicrobia bacterium]|nr:myo-inosose-2 dehydratase [Elusimicrobiota bacterium]
MRIAAQPIGWINDDFKDLGDDISLDRCLSEMREAGYEGTELGRKFPKNPSQLKAALKPYGLSLASGWHSLHLLSKPYEEEEKKFLTHMQFLSEMKSQVVIVAECTHATYGSNGPHRHSADSSHKIDAPTWQRLIEGLERLAETAKQNGMRLAYHHHMGTVIQNEEEIDRLMKDTRHLFLLADTGHMAYAGIDPLPIFKKYGNRIAHIHLKDVRPQILAQAHQQGYSFEKAVREGVFTVPGDGGIHYAPLFQHLNDLGYEGWWVMEAEQDPIKANPLRYAKMGRDYIRKVANL